MQEAPLSNLSLLASLSIEDLEALALTTQVRRFPLGSILLQEGDTGEHFYILMEGHVEIVRFLGTEEERFVAKRGPDDFIGETALLSDERTRSASVRALGDVQALEITHAGFELLLRQQPDVALRMMQEMSRRRQADTAAMIRELRLKNEQLNQAYWELHARERRLRHQVEQLKIEIDRSQQDQQVAEITESEFFRNLEAKAADLRQSMGGPATSSQYEL